MWWETRGHLTVKNNRLFIGNADTTELAERFGTPLYLLNKQRVIDNYTRLYNAYSKYYNKLTVHYATKANSSLAVCTLLRKLGAGADVVSGGELQIALMTGFSPGKIIFTNNTKSGEEYSLAIRKNVVLNLDSENELAQINRIAKQLGKKAKVSFRINPAVESKTHSHLSTGKAESKFGIPYDNVVAAYQLALSNDHIEPYGIHTHIGSQILESAPFVKGAQKILDMAGRLKDIGIKVKFIDLGGGFGIRYRKEQRPLDIKTTAKKVMNAVNQKLQEYNLGKPEIKLEPGRYITGDAEILLAKVQTIKQGNYKKFISVDAGFQTLARPIMYDAHHEVVLANNVSLTKNERVEVVGNICESGDILAKERTLPLIQENDIVAFLCAGAYGISMSSQYNVRPKPAEVMVTNGKAQIIRTRETFRELIKHERIPKGL